MEPGAPSSTAIPVQGQELRVLLDSTQQSGCCTTFHLWRGIVTGVRQAWPVESDRVTPSAIHGKPCHAKPDPEQTCARYRFDLSQYYLLSLCRRHMRRTYQVFACTKSTSRY